MEISAWICYTLYTKVVASLIFCVVGGIQMYFWAKKKQRALCQEFPEARTRGALTPFF